MRLYSTISVGGFYFNRLLVHLAFCIWDGCVPYQFFVIKKFIDFIIIIPNFKFILPPLKGVG
ncbi:MAG: hypothetical protein LBP59_13795 [Planctomycetaceae bacterium]|nr:hypothetical protein [Planctomycetaceae bacterium]